MTKSFFDKLCCPFDRAELSIQVFTEKENNAIHEGLINCPTCKRLYPIIHGVPIMIPDSYRQPELEQSFFVRWNDKLSLEVKEHLMLEE